MRDSTDKEAEVNAQLSTRRRRRWLWSDKELNRQGDDNTDNFVVLLSSLGLLAFVGIAFAVYYWGWPYAALTKAGGG